ncbi:hypothetical protein ABPG75_009414 [Micractinium tetrahymenae]
MKSRKRQPLPASAPAGACEAEYITQPQERTVKPGAKYTFAQRWIRNFESPRLSLDASGGYPYVLERERSRVQAFNSEEGKYILTWGKPGSGEGETFQAPRDLAGADDGSMVVLDRCGLKRFSAATGDVIKTWGSCCTGEDQAIFILDDDKYVKRLVSEQEEEHAGPDTAAPPAMSQQPYNSPPSSGPGAYSHEIHLLHRKAEVADKPQLHSWSSDDYATSLAAEAQQRAARYEQAATAMPPWAADAGALTRIASSSSTSSTGPLHQAPQPAGKVTSSAIGADASRAAHQDSAAARQRNMQAMAGSAPFAVQPGEGGTAAAPPASAYHFRRPERAEPPGKVGALPPDTRLEPRKQADLSSKVTDCEWNQQRAEDEGRQRLAVHQASRRRNWGTPGLIG